VNGEENPGGGNKMMENENLLKGYGKAQRADVIEMGGKTYFSSFEAARKLGVCQVTWFTLKKRYGLKGVRIGKKKYYGEEELKRLVFDRKFEEKK
jgi:hypothetical protein